MTQQTNYYPEGVGGAPGLGFIALSVTIDNYSGSWGWVPGAGRYVRPWTQGAVFSLGSTQAGDIEWQTPPNISPAPVGNGQLTAIWSDIPPTSAMVSEGTGISVFSASSNPIPIAGSVATPYPVQTTAQLLTIPSGLQSLAIYNPSLTQSITLTVLGVQSGIYYARAYVLPQTFTGQLDNPLAIYLSPLDTQISLLSGIGIRNVIIIGYPSPLVPVPLEISLPTGASAPLSVTPVLPLGPTGAVETMQSAIFNQLLNAASGEVVPAVANQKISVWGWCLQVSSGQTANADIQGILEQDDGLLQIDQAYEFVDTLAGAIASAPICRDLTLPLVLGNGLGIRVRNPNAYLIRILGSIQFTQE